MVTHGSAHVCDVLALALDLLMPPLEKWKKEQKSIEDAAITGEELFLLITDIFLHDIGMV